MSGQMAVPQIYRGFLRALKNYPSVKRDSMILMVKDEFHVNKFEANAEKAKEQRQMALMELERLRKYTGIDSSASGDIDLKL